MALMIDMEFKPLLLVSAIIGVLAGYFFYRQQDLRTVITPPKPTLNSSVDNFKAVQSNPNTGEIEYTLTAKQLTENLDNTSQIHELSMTWAPFGATKNHYQLQAKTGNFNQAQGVFLLNEGFILNNPNAKLTIIGNALTAQLNQKTLKSNTPLTIEQDGKKFSANGFLADLATGQYDFFQVKITFDSPNNIKAQP